MSQVLTSVDGDRTIQLRGHSHILTKSGNTTISRFTQHGVNLRYYRHCIRGQGSFPTPILVKTFSEEWQFECEATSYALLKDLQGDIVPRCYGNFTTLQSNKAILIELLPGHDLSKAVIDREYVPHIRKALEHCYRELAQRGVCQSDPKPTNVMLVELTGLAYLSWLPRMIFNGSSCNVARTKSGGLGARNFLLPLVTCILSIWYAGVGDSLRITLQVISVRVIVLMRFIAPLTCLGH